MTTPELGQLLAYLAIAFMLGLTTGAMLTFGLYLGERGRRLDAQRREGVLQVDRAAPATVRSLDPHEASGTESELAEAPARFIRETMEETGCSEKEAQEEWRRLVAQSFGDRAGGWAEPA